jgi:hypothetical protein
MPITTIYEVFFNGNKWVANLGDQYFDRAQMMAKIKSKIGLGLEVEEEWAALALIERRTTEARWKTAQNK